MLKEPVRAGHISIEIFQGSDRIKIQEEVNQWLQSHHEFMVQDILYSYGYTISNPTDSYSQHYSHGYSVVIIYSPPNLSNLNQTRS